MDLDDPDIIRQLCDLILEEARQVSQRTRDQLEVLCIHFRIHAQNASFPEWEMDDDPDGEAVTIGESIFADQPNQVLGWIGPGARRDHDARQFVLDNTDEPIFGV
jgi:hypothetical protein